MSVENLESNVFRDDIDFKSFESILETLDHVAPKKISRSEFDNLKGDFLKEAGEDKFGKKYDLYLPDDLKVSELPAIISRVNKLTFGETLPDYASTIELKVKFAITINTLVDALKRKNLDDKGKKEIQKAIKNYTKLFEDLFGSQEYQKIGDENYRNEIIKNGEKTINTQRYKEYAEKLVKISTREKLDELLGEIEGNISKETKKHFTESFLERGTQLLRYGMMTITQAEQEAKIKYCEENGYKKETTPDGKIIYSKDLDDTIVIHVETKDLDIQERLLRDKIGIDKIKKELEEAKKTGNESMINTATITATNEVLKGLYSILYNINSNSYGGYQPNKIAEFKEAYCVGFSLLGHTFLSELGIKHNGLQIPGHSALEIPIGGKNYYFDGTLSPNILEIQEQGKEGDYRKVEVNAWFKKFNFKIKAGVPEEVILGQIYSNNGAHQDSELYQKEVLRMYKKAIELGNDGVLSDILDIQRKIGNHEEIVNITRYLIKQEPNNIENYIQLANSLEMLNKKEEAHEVYNQALKTSPSSIKLYLYKFAILSLLQKPKIAEVYKFAYDYYETRKGSLEKDRKKEETEIKKLINKKDFDGLRDYLLKLEKRGK